MNILFRNARIIDPYHAFDGRNDLWVKDGRIEALESHLDLPKEILSGIQTMDASSWWIVPNLVDMHVHLREPGEEYKETIASGTRAAVAGGFGALACMPNTNPVNDSAAVTRYILEKARMEGSCTVYPVAAISKGLEGRELAEFGELRDAGAVAVTDDGRPVMDAQLMRRALEYAKAYDLVVISHAEDLHLSDGGVMNEGTFSTRLGLKGIPAAAEAVMVARDILLADLTQSRLHIAHVSTEASVRIIRWAKSRGIPISAETAPHYFSLTDASLVTYDPNFKMNPPLRSMQDVEAVKEGLKDGTIDAIATDHAPHSLLEKDTEFELAANGIIGLESAVPLMMELIRDGIGTPLEIFAKVTVQPSRILSFDPRGIRPGHPASFTVIDAEREYAIDVTTFQSKARNCPFHGRRVRGRVLMTVIEGAIRFNGSTS